MLEKNENKISLKWLIQYVGIVVIIGIISWVFYLSNSLADHKLYAAQTYPTNIDMERMEVRIMYQFDKLYKAVDKIDK